MRNRQFAVDDGFQAQACAGVPFTNKPMLGITLCCEQLTPQITMTNIRGATLASYVGSIGLKYANIVEHASLLDKSYIHCQLGMITGNRKCFIRHLIHMGEVN